MMAVRTFKRVEKRNLEIGGCGRPGNGAASGKRPEEPEVFCTYHVMHEQASQHTGDPLSHFAGERSAGKCRKMQENGCSGWLQIRCGVELQCRCMCGRGHDAGKNGQIVAGCE